VAALVVLGIYVLVLFAVGRTAQNYGRRTWPWVLLAVFIGIFAFIPLLIAGRSKAGQLMQLAEEQELRRSLQPQAPATQQLKELGELRSAGVLTDEEFEAKKAALLERI